MIGLRITTATLTGLSAVSAAYLARTTPGDLGFLVWIGLLMFLIISVIAESKPLQLPATSAGYAELSATGLASYAMIGLFPPLLAAATGALAVAITQLTVRKKPAIKVAFNTSQTFLSLVVAALVFRWTEAVADPTPVPVVILATLAGVFAYFLVNSTLVSIALSQLNRSSFWRTWVGSFRWEVVYIFGTIPIAVLLILSYQRLWIAGPLLFIAPLFLLRESYAQYVRLKNTYTETVKTLIKVIETHDTYTAGHSARVAEYSKRLALAAGLGNREVEKIEIAAYLHDLGKVDLAITHLVRKPGRLTPEEKRRVQLHPLVSADLAAQVTYFRGDIEKIIRHHHEHFNGTGYPHGLVGEEIPLGSRIILIADAFDAMTSNRMYRSALDLERVAFEFRKYAGVQFDPQLTEVFLSVCVKDESSVIPQVDLPYDGLPPPRDLPGADLGAAD